jgi:hypothetical protein
VRACVRVRLLLRLQPRLVAKAAHSEQLYRAATRRDSPGSDSSTSPLHAPLEKREVVGLTVTNGIGYAASSDSAVSMVYSEVDADVRVSVVVEPAMRDALVSGMPRLDVTVATGVSASLPSSGSSSPVHSGATTPTRMPLIAGPRARRVSPVFDTVVDAASVSARTLVRPSLALAVARGSRLLPPIPGGNARTRVGSSGGSSDGGGDGDSTGSNGARDKDGRRDSAAPRASLSVPRVPLKGAWQPRRTVSLATFAGESVSLTLLRACSLRQVKARWSVHLRSCVSRRCVRIVFISCRVLS